MISQVRSYFFELETGIEPATTCLQDRCATVAPLQREGTDRGAAGPLRV